MPKKSSFREIQAIYDRIWSALAEQGYHSDNAKLKRIRHWGSLDAMPFLTMEQRMKLKAQGQTPSSIHAWFARNR